jgi:hypothetical protein
MYGCVKTEIDKDIAGKTMAVSIAMQMWQYDVGCITRWSTSRVYLKPLDAAIGQVPVPYCPGSHHG